MEFLFQKQVRRETSLGHSSCLESLYDESVQLALFSMGVRRRSSLLLSLEFMDWHLQWGNVFLTDNSATVGRILMISSADPLEILMSIKW